jgi:hypothetical protein
MPPATPSALSSTSPICSTHRGHRQAPTTPFLRRLPAYHSHNTRSIPSSQVSVRLWVCRRLRRTASVVAAPRTIRTVATAPTAYASQAVGGPTPRRHAGISRVIRLAPSHLPAPRLTQGRPQGNPWPAPPRGRLRLPSRLPWPRRRPGGGVATSRELRRLVARGRRDSRSSSPPRHAPSSTRPPRCDLRPRWRPGSSAVASRLIRLRRTAARFPCSGARAPRRGVSQFPRRRRRGRCSVPPHRPRRRRHLLLTGTLHQSAPSEADRPAPSAAYCLMVGDGRRPRFVLRGQTGEVRARRGRASSRGRRTVGVFPAGGKPDK